MHWARIWSCPLSSGGQVMKNGAGEQQKVVMEGGQPTVSDGVSAGNGSVTSDAALAQLAVEAFLLEGGGC